MDRHVRLPCSSQGCLREISLTQNKQQRHCILQCLFVLTFCKILPFSAYLFPRLSPFCFVFSKYHTIYTCHCEASGGNLQPIGLRRQCSQAFPLRVSNEKSKSPQCGVCRCEGNRLVIASGKRWRRSRWMRCSHRRWCSWPHLFPQTTLYTYIQLYISTTRLLLLPNLTKLW